MSHYQATMSKMKNRLLNLLIDKIEERSYYEWFTLLDQDFKRYFHVHETEFYIYHASQNKFIAIKNYTLPSWESSSEFSKELVESGKEGFIHYLQKVGHGNIDDFIVFKNNKSEPLALLLIESTDAWLDFAKSVYFQEFEAIIGGFITSIRQLNGLITEGKKFRLLFNTTESFTSTMTSETILDRMLETVQRILPLAKTRLILSREQSGMNHTYEIFNQVENSPLIVKTFLNGVMTKEINEEKNIISMNAPVKGRQGVYGVLNIEVPKGIFYSSTQRNLIYMLVNTTGRALENASLYNQAHRLNEDLQLVNETSQKLNSSLTLREMLAYLKKQLEKVLIPDEVLFIFYDQNQEYELVETTSCFFKEREGKEYIQYVSHYIKQEKTPLFEADFESTLTKHPLYKSVIGMPILNQEEVIGIAICLHKEKYFFSFDHFKLVESLIIHASLSISNLQLREKMRELAEKDHLTGLYARRYLEKQIYQVIEENQGGSFLLFDIDNFKLINDEFGHDVGDRVLKQIGTLLIEKMKSAGIAARWGGEEFAVYLPIYKKAELETLSQKLLERIPTITNPSVTVSMGLVYWEPGVYRSFDLLFKKADKMLYQAKDQGKNQLVL